MGTGRRRRCPKSPGLPDSLRGMAIRLQTNRLVLRSFGGRDVDDWIAMFTHPEVTRYLDPASRERPRPPETFRANLTIRREMEAELGYAVLAVELADTGEF